ncbi:hypothetical protein [uncultured Campylobacter sp.]|uniref:hypothetical protein n=1 Tax=uncultured Campylobacter sp. TaxID=218934 RepID=UPI0026274F46|nr:hypothetical protein [uncultured Campylobacter sp.]
MKVKVFFGAAIAAFVLCGCGEDNVKIVKEYTLPQQKSMTIGNAIDGSSECKKVSWQDISVKNSIQAVKMICEVSPEVLKAEFDKANAAYEKAYASEAESKEKRFQNSLKYASDSYERLKTQSSPQFDKDEILQIANKFCKFDEEKSKSLSFGSQVKCDYDALQKEIAEVYKLNANNWSYANFLNLVKDVAASSQRPVNVLFIDKPVRITSRQIEIKFIVNTDKSVDVDRTAIMIEDGSAKEIGSGILRKFYKR